MQAPRFVRLNQMIRSFIHHKLALPQTLRDRKEVVILLGKRSIVRMKLIDFGH